MWEINISEKPWHLIEASMAIPKALDSVRCVIGKNFPSL